MPKAHRPGRGPSIAPPGTLAGRRARQEDVLSYHDIPEDTPDVPEADPQTPPDGQAEGASGATPEADATKTPETPEAEPKTDAPKTASTGTRARAGVAHGTGKSRA